MYSWAAIAMGTKAVTFCDVCQSSENVAPITVVRSHGKGDPWEADICEVCYQQRFGDLEAFKRRPMKSNIRPQHRFKKVEITEANL